MPIMNPNNTTRNFANANRSSPQNHQVRSRDAHQERLERVMRMMGLPIRRNFVRQYHGRRGGRQYLEDTTASFPQANPSSEDYDSEDYDSDSDEDDITGDEYNSYDPNVDRNLAAIGFTLDSSPMRPPQTEILGNNPSIPPTGYHRSMSTFGELSPEALTQFPDAEYKGLADAWTLETVKNRIGRLTVAKLKDLCHHFRLSKYGKKADLVERCVDEVMILVKGATAENATFAQKEEFNKSVRLINTLYGEMANTHIAARFLLHEMVEEADRKRLLESFIPLSTPFRLQSPFILRRPLSQPILASRVSVHLWPLEVSFEWQKKSSASERVLLIILEVPLETRFGADAPCIQSTSRIASRFSYQLNQTPNNIKMSCGTRAMDRMHDLTPELQEGTNRLTIRDRFSGDHAFNRPDREFYIQVCLIESNLAAWNLLALDQMIVRSIDQVIQQQQSRSSADLVEATTMALSLRCPWTLVRMKKPVRSIKCSHLQCFDLSSWVQLAQKTGGGRCNCPICNKEITSLGELFTDAFTLDILGQVDEAVDSVIVDLEQFTWRLAEPSRKVPPVVEARPPKPEIIDLTDCDDNSPPILWTDIKPDPLGGPIPATTNAANTNTVTTPKRPHTEPILIDDSDSYRLEIRIDDDDSHHHSKQSRRNDGRLHSFFSSNSASSPRPGSSLSTAIVLD